MSDILPVSVGIVGPRWEYLAAEFQDHKTFRTDCTLLGEIGWELVHIEKISVAAAFVGFFKRPHQG